MISTVMLYSLLERRDRTERRIEKESARLFIQLITERYGPTAYVVCDDADGFPTEMRDAQDEVVATFGDIRNDSVLEVTVGNMPRRLLRYRNLPSPDQFPRGETRIVIDEVKEYLA